MKRFWIFAFCLLFFSEMTSAQTQEILNRWAEAIGGKEKLASIKTIHTTAAVSYGGLTGTAEDWNTSSGNHKSTFVLGENFNNVTVYDSILRNGWLKDDNGKVRELESAELQAEITTAYLGSFSMFFPDRMKGSAYVEGEDATKQLIVLKILPDGGRAATVYLDKKTFLPARMEQQEADRTQTTTFSDYRSADGIQQPFSMRQSTGDPKYDLSITVQATKWNEPLEASAFAKPTENPPDFHFASGNQAIGIPFELTSNHIYVQLSVNHSQPLWFLLDTGAEYGIINEPRAKELGLKLQGKLEGRGSGENSTDVSLISDVSFDLKGVEVLHQHAATINLEPIESFEGRKMDGIIGYDFISRFVVEIDYAAKVVNLFDPKSYKYTGSGSILPIELEANTPVVRAAVEAPGVGSFEGRFSIDTGSRFSVSLHKPFHESHQLSDLVGKTIEAPTGFGVGGQTKQKIGRLSHFRIGRADLKNVLVSFSLDAKGAEANPDLMGNIGGEILRRFKVIFDYSNKRMILEPNADFSDEFAYDASGMAIACNNSDLRTFKVINVLEGSPAAAAGIQVGDLLQTINGRNISEFTLDDLRALLKKQNQTFELTTNRGTVTIKTRALI